MQELKGIVTGRKPDAQESLFESFRRSQAAAAAAAEAAASAASKSATQLVESAESVAKPPVAASGNPFSGLFGAKAPLLPQPKKDPLAESGCPTHLPFPTCRCLMP